MRKGDSREMEGCREVGKKEKEGTRMRKRKRRE